MKKLQKDVERINKLKFLLESEGVEILITGYEPNIRYLLGSPVDYAYAYILKSGEVGVLCSILERERAEIATWADMIYAYTLSKEQRSEYTIYARNIYEAIAKLTSKFVSKGLKVAIDVDNLRYGEAVSIKRKLRGFKVVNFSDKLREARIMKTKFEIENIKRAVNIVIDGINYSISKLLKNNPSELEIFHEAEYYMKRKGAEKIHDFLIVASGENSAYPHSRPTNRRIRDGDPVTLDYVASYNGYYGDLTRTIFIGAPSKELKKIYNVVKEALELGIEAAKEGVKASEVDKVVRDHISKEGYGKYFIHSTGHGVGLEIHEPPRLSRVDSTILKERMIVTIEPGIYIKGLGGVRIEEDILIEKHGCKVLSSKLSTELTIVG